MLFVFDSFCISNLYLKELLVETIVLNIVFRLSNLVEEQFHQ